MFRYSIILKVTQKEIPYMFNDRSKRKTFRVTPVPFIVMFAMLNHHKVLFTL